MLLQAGNISTQEMFRTFNMGIGMVVVVSPADVGIALQVEPEAIVLGEVVRAEGVGYE